MVKKTNAGCNIGKARPIEVESDLNARFLGLACDCAFAHEYVFASSRFERRC
jgi:hypothetical protein